MRRAWFLIVPVFGVSGDYLTGYVTGRIPAARDELVRAIVITAVVVIAVHIAKRFDPRRSS